MKLPPLMRTNEFDDITMDVKFTFSGECLGEGSIEIKDEGAGSFIVIDTSDRNGLRLDPKELLDIGMWAVNACRELDEFNNSKKE